MKYLLLTLFLTGLIVNFAIGAPNLKSGVKGHNVYQELLNDTTYHGPNHFPNMRNLTGSSLISFNGTKPYRNNSKPIDYEKGVCYVEVPTITLVKDPANVPHGNGSTPKLSKIRKCCPGYVKNIHNYRLCEPVCEQECVNGNCIAPNVCACHPDHVLNLDAFCVPTCPIGCLNGHCGTDNQCECKPGYELDVNKKFCHPKCSNGCGAHGNCTHPEVCKCDFGYELNENSQCVPYCEGCQNGKCVAPGECICKHGYEKDKDDKCSPICSQGCLIGECIAPETCSCGHGFAMSEDGYTCKPVCDNPCLNGECTGPNQCTCKAGYIHDSKDETRARCIGHCPNECPNGTCSGPNLCLCLPGYTKDRSVKGSQVCLKRSRRNIEHGLKFMIP